MVGRPHEYYLPPEHRHSAKDVQLPIGTSPRPGHGKVYVTVDRHGVWLGSWQDPGPPLNISNIEGSRDDVLTWAQAQPALQGFLFDPELDDYVPLRLNLHRASGSTNPDGTA